MLFDFSPTSHERLIIYAAAPMETICENRDTALHMRGVGGYRLTPEALVKYAGKYEFGSGRDAVITVDGPTLILNLGSQRAQTFTRLRRMSVR